MFVQSVSFTNAPFNLIPVNSSLKNAFGHGDHHLVGCALVWKKNDFEGEQIKRGTLMEEFLN